MSELIHRIPEDDGGFRSRILKPASYPARIRREGDGKEYDSLYSYLRKPLDAIFSVCYIHDIFLSVTFDRDKMRNAGQHACQASYVPEFYKARHASALASAGL